MANTADLLILAQSGDSNALTELLLILQPDIRRYARRQCHTSSVLEDVVQEALIVVFRRIGTLRSAESLAGWLFTVVGRLCMLPTLMLIKVAEHFSVDEGNDAFATRSVDDLRIDLARALESLPATHRDIVLLRDFEELTIAEIADRLQLTHEATKSRLHRARVLLREYLTDSAS